MVKKNKFLAFILLLISFFCFFVSLSPVCADDFLESDEIDTSVISNEQILETSNTENSTPKINSRSAVVIDRNTQTILYGKDENSKRKMASTTKIMTCIVILENCDLNNTVTISKKSAMTGGSRLGLKYNDKISVKDLLYGLMLCSGNDAAVALAEFAGGSIENFAILMNNKAKELNLQNTNFVTPHGLDQDEHYTTAYELALLSNYALNNPTFSKIVGTKNYTITINGSPKNIRNTNELLGYLDGVYGIKTGFTNGANRCLVSACKRKNMDIICVILGADTKKFRTQDSIKLIEYVFNNFEPVNIEKLINKNFEEWQKENLNDFNFNKSQKYDLKLKYVELKYNIYPINKDLIDRINISIDCKNDFESPKNKNDKIGTMKVYVDSSEFLTLDILLDCDIYKKNIYNYFYELLSCYENLIYAIFI